jgi:4-hydroxybenzoate polyprenyltransferase
VFIEVSAVRYYASVKEYMAEVFSCCIFVDLNMVLINMDKVRRLIELTVPSRVIIPVGSFIAAVLILMRYVPFPEIVLPVLCVVLADLCSSVLNSISDIHSDKINSPRRPLVNGTMTCFEAYLFFFFLFCVMILFALPFGLLFILSLLFRLFIELIYSSVQFKKYFGINYLLVGLSYGLSPLLSAWIYVYPNLGILFPPLFVLFSLLVVAMSPLKDFKDVAGDKLCGVSTLPVLFGIKKALLISGLTVFTIFCIFIYYIIKIKLFMLEIPTMLSLVLLLLFYFYSSQRLFFKNSNISITKLQHFSIFSTICGVLVELIYAISLMR